MPGAYAPDGKAALQLFLGILAGGRHVVKILRDRGVRDRGAILCKPRVAGVADNRQQSGAGRSALVSRKESDRAQACLVQHVFRVLVCGGQPAGQAIGGV